MQVKKNDEPRQGESTVEVGASSDALEREEVEDPISRRTSHVESGDGTNSGGQDGKRSDEDEVDSHSDDDVSRDSDDDGVMKFDSTLTRDPEARKDFLEAPASGIEYAYQSLQNGQIRLVKLLPGYAFEPLQCEIEHHSLSGKLRFEALSYSWGDPRLLAHISVNGQPLCVRQALKIALAYLRRQEEARLLWIDAICINQGDNLEKATQVSLMRSIYEHAFQTVVWLGEGPPPDDALRRRSSNMTAFDMCQRIEMSRGKIKPGLDFASDASSNPVGRWLGNRAVSAAELALGSEFFSYTKSEQRKIYTAALQIAYESEKTGVENVDAEYVPNSGIMEKFWRDRERRTEVMESPVDFQMMIQFTSLADMLNRAWFSRVWVLQEVAVAQQVIVQCGPGTMKWRTLALSCLVIHHASALSKSGMLLAKVDFSKILRIAALRGMVQRQKDGKLSKRYEESLRLPNLVKRYRSWDASDPRDKIYALCGLSPVSDIDIDISYTRSVEDIYKTFAIAVLLRNAGSDLWSGLQVSPPVSSERPSWVPDWSNNSPQLDLLYDAATEQILVNKHAADRSFSAAPQDSQRRIALLSLSTLKVHGLTLGQVTELGDPINGYDANIDVFGFAEESEEEQLVLIKPVVRLFMTLNEWTQIARVDQKNEKYRTGESIEEAYRCLLNLDLIPRNCDPALARRAFAKWRRRCKTMFDVLDGAEGIGMDLQKLEFRDDSVVKVWDNMIERSCDFMNNEGGNPITAVGMAYREGYVKKLWPNRGAIWKIAKGAMYARWKRFNLGLILDNPLACSLEHINGRRLARTDSGFLALAAADAEVGDHLALIEGAKVPFVLRARDQKWEMVGSAYVHGAMYGEQWRPEKCFRMELV